jgi:glucose/arabinose dehydrogenase
LLVAIFIGNQPDAGSAIAPLPFLRGTLQNLSPHPAHPTSMAFGPDGRLYVTTESSIRALTLSADGKGVTSSEVIASGLSLVLGIAFDPTGPPSPVTFYVSRQEPTAPDGYNGTISMYTGPGPTWTRTDVITGLPTSEPNLNHMTNGIAFDPQGVLYITQGSASDAGLPLVNGTPTFWNETPLSAAILVADIHAAGFNGAITYSPSGPPATGNIDQASGDVHVFAPGLRNPYDLVLHTNGHIYATDNGPIGGPSSATCNTETSSSAVSQSDELNLISQGNYYGFPNRNRGRTDTRQCTYHSPDEASGADWKAPIAVLQAHCSCDGIAEYTADAFGGQLFGNLLIAQYAISGLARVQLTADGTGVSSTTTLASGFQGPLDVVVGPTGIIYVAEHDGDRITYLAPAGGTPGSPTATATTGSPTATQTPTATRTPATPTAPAPGTPSSTPASSPSAVPTETATVPTITPTPTQSATVVPSPTPTLAGDVNCDGLVTAIDAALILQYSAALFSHLPCPGGGDVNGDGRVDPIDATLVLQYVAGLLQALSPH